MPNKAVKHRRKGKPKVVNKQRSASAPHTFKKMYTEDIKCRSCNDGVLKRMQWNRLLCTNRKCKHSELI